MPAAPSIEPQLVAGDCTVPLSVDVDPSAWPAPVQALAHTPGSGARPTSLAELTTLRVGGPVGSYVEATTQSELTEAIREADAAGTVLGTFTSLKAFGNVIYSTSGMTNGSTYTVSVDAAQGVTTGISAADRTRTLRAPLPVEDVAVGE